MGQELKRRSLTLFLFSECRREVQEKRRSSVESAAVEGVLDLETRESTI